MIYLLLSVLASTLIFVVFKLFSKFKMNTLHAIVVNYFVACVSGIIAFEGEIQIAKLPTYDWFYFTLALGALFIIVFNLMAITTQRSGLSVVSVATKMSVVIPVVFGLLYYKDGLGVFKTIGILLALVAVYLASVKKKEGLKIKPRNLIFPVLVFLGSGIIDTSIKYLEGSFVAEHDVPLFSATIFSAAFTIGIVVLVVQKIRGKFRFQFKNILGGLMLGVPNYFSIYFLVKALRSGLFESSGIFTVNNVAIVMLSTFVGILFFKERLLPKNWLGIGLAVVSIVLIALEKIV
ncbi:DMT family transporter [Marinirhabdus gelatinilytica]|uniref:Putative membrane protein n=1 Tax=Marinirhabdus gelatinilytica TaxID=1703343 RepID=A0A370QER2_9FLAO|nr:DMT family transporter [Marinirhabdus gelatinilytica]RDK86853.1 putative membrane protein [Marinirhabdus gelatinilytica]